jgi:hypothetical protein
MIRREAGKYPNFHIIDGSRLVPHLPDFYADPYLLHPNDLGFYSMAVAVGDIIEKILVEA